jgi:hypothetical protein
MEAFAKLRWQATNDDLADTLAENGIVLGKDAVLDIKFTWGQKYTVSGIEDAEKRRVIEEILKDVLHVSNVKVQPDMSFPSFSKIDDFTRQTAVTVGYAKQYLADNTDSGATLADMSLGADGKIYGGLPQDILDELNAAVILKDTDDISGLSKAQRDLCDRKLAFTLTLTAIKRYGYENIPEINYYYTYSNGQLTTLDKCEYENPKAASGKFTIPLR